MKKKEVQQTGLQSERATFADVARMIAPSNMPPWLPAHLEWWAQGIRHDRMADQYRPTTSQTVERLSETVKALRVLERNLSDPNIRNLLEFARMPNKIELPIATLKAMFAACFPLHLGQDRDDQRSKSICGKMSAASSTASTDDVPFAFAAPLAAQVIGGTRIVFLVPLHFSRLGDG